MRMSRARRSRTHPIRRRRCDRVGRRVSDLRHLARATSAFTGTGWLLDPSDYRVASPEQYHWLLSHSRRLTISRPRRWQC